jgi:hypothetical protein
MVPTSCLELPEGLRRYTLSKPSQSSQDVQSHRACRPYPQLWAHLEDEEHLVLQWYRRLRRLSLGVREIRRNRNDCVCDFIERPAFSRTLHSFLNFGCYLFGVAKPFRSVDLYLNIGPAVFLHDFVGKYVDFLFQESAA